MSMQNFILPCACLLLTVLAGRSLAVTYSNCRLPTFCTADDGSAASVWSDLNRNIIQPPPPQTPPACPTLPPPAPTAATAAPTQPLSDNEQIVKLNEAITRLAEPGWFNGLGGYQYWRSAANVYVTFSMANTTCQEKNAHVAYVGFQTEANRKFLIDNVLSQVSAVHAWWVGMQAPSRQDQGFVYLDGVEGISPYAEWANNQPDESGRCAVVPRWTGYKLDDVPCEGSTNGIICERLVIQ